MPTGLRLALVPGEPAGIGPEICARVAGTSHAAELVVFADRDVLLAGAANAGVALELIDSRLDAAPLPQPAGRLAILHVPCPAPTTLPGSPSPCHARHVIDCLQQAIDACLRGECDGLVTGPVQKSSINAAGLAFSGTTELLAQRCGGVPVVMMLATPELRVALATTHLPLRAVPDAITPQRLLTGLRVLHAALRSEFAISQPTIAVLGLNPHAGESGHMGREEIDIIEPVLQQLRAEGMQLIGPLAADTAFLPDKLRGFDAVYAMYHDQGLPVLKASGFERAVNITLGLPFPRVAVDHGTALDIAGRGLADPSSLCAAIDLATRLAGNRRQAA